MRNDNGAYETVQKIKQLCVVSRKVAEEKLAAELPHVDVGILRNMRPYLDLPKGE